MMPPTSIDGTDITGATIDGTDVQEITVDGQTVFTAVPPLPGSAVHQWKFDEGSGTTATDSIGSNDGTINGATFTSDANLVGGFGLDFDGNDTVDYSTIGSVLAINQDFSVAMTVNLDNLSTEQHFLSHVTSSNDRVEIGTSRNVSGTFAFSTFDGTVRGVRSTTAAQAARQRIGVSHDASSNTHKIFINGVDETDVSDRTNLSGDTGFKIGGQSNDTDHMTGILDNVIVFDEVLSNQQFLDDFNRQPWS